MWSFASSWWKERMEDADGDILWIFDVDDDLLWMSEEMSRLAGLADSPPTGARHWLLQNIHPEDQSRVLTNLRRAVAEKRPRLTFHYRLLTPQGTYQDLHCKAALLYGQNGRLSRIVGRNVGVESGPPFEEIQAWFFSALAACPDAVASVTPDGILCGWNPGAERTFGYAAHEVLGRSVFDVLVPKSEEQATRDLQRRIFSGEVIRELRVRRQAKDGSPIDISLTVTPVRDARGTALGALAIMRDLREQLQEKEKSRRQEELANLLVKSSVDGIIAFDCEYRYTLWNPAVERLTGTPSSHTLGRNAFELFPFLLENGVAEEMRETLAGQPPSGRSHALCLPGHPGSYEAHYSTLRDWEGGIIGGLILVRDVTDLKTREAQLRRSEDMIRRLLEPDLLGVIRGDLEHITDANDTFLRLIGMSRNEFSSEGLSWRAITPPEYRTLDQAAIDTLRETGICAPFEKELLRRDGSRVPILLGGTRLETEPFSWVSFVLDLTKQKKAEAAAVRAARELARSNKELEEFAYVVSHDFKEPLRMISSFLSLLSRRYQGQLDASADEYIRFAVEGAKRMTQLIDDLLEYSRVTRLGETPASVESAKVAQRVLERLGPLARAAGAEIVIGPLPRVTADERQLTLVFTHLFENAIKFRGPKPLRVRVSAERKGAELEFCVEDNGRGIPPEARERVFVVFQRLQGPAESEGTGIGLAVCKKIINRHGGRIWATGNESGGTSLCFTLPA